MVLSASDILRTKLTPPPARADLVFRPRLTQRVSATYGVPVAGLLPFSEDVAFNSSANIFALLYPNHPWTTAMREITADVIKAAD